MNQETNENKETNCGCCSCGTDKKPCKKGAILIALILVIAVAAGLYWYLNRSTPALSSDGNLLTMSEKLAPANTELFYAFQPDTTGKVYQKWQEQWKGIEQNAGFLALQDDLRQKYGMELPASLIKLLEPRGIGMAAWPLEGKPSVFTDIKTFKGDVSVLPFHVVGLLNMGSKVHVLELLGKTMPEFAAKMGLVYKTEKQGEYDVSLLEKTGTGNKLYWTFVGDVVLIAFNTQDMTLALDRLKQGHNDLATNPIYAGVRTKAPKSFDALGFWDCRGLVSSLPATALPDPQKQQLLKSLGSVEVVSVSQGNLARVLMDVVVDYAKAGPLGSLLAAHKSVFVPKMAAQLPVGTTVAATLDLKSIWSLVSQFMTVMPQPGFSPEVVNQVLAPMGLTLEADVLPQITGELALAMVSSQGVAGVPPEMAANPMMMMAEFSNNVVGLLGIANKDGFKATFEKLAGPFLATAQKEDHEGFEIWNLGQGAYAYVNDFLVVAAQPQPIKVLIDNLKKGATLETRTSYTGSREMLWEKNPQLTLLMDMTAYAQKAQQFFSMAETMNSGGAEPAGNQQNSAVAKEQMQALANLYGDFWMSFGLTPTGLRVAGTIELK